jgi:hypothetical protein
MKCVYLLEQPGYGIGRREAIQDITAQYKILNHKMPENHRIRIYTYKVVQILKDSLNGLL